MDLERLNVNSEPGYPTLKDHTINRRSALRAIAGGMAAAGLLGCKKEEPPQIMGEMCAPAQPEPTPVEQEIKKPGEIRAPGKPQPPSKGSMPAPQPQEDPHVDGDMPMPVKPERPQEQPAIRGKIVAPKQPAK